MSLVLADVGIPMILLELPFMVAAFVPIVLVEAAVLVKRLAIPFRRAVRCSALANGFSTLVGVPLTWVGMFILEMLGSELKFTPRTSLTRVLSTVGGAAWLGPEAEEHAWMIPTAALTLLVPTFFMSAWLEWDVLQARLEDFDRKRARKAVWTANAVSYSVLFVLSVVWLCFESSSSPS